MEQARDVPEHALHAHVMRAARRLRPPADKKAANTLFDLGDGHGGIDPLAGEKHLRHRVQLYKLAAEGVSYIVSIGSSATGLATQTRASELKIAHGAPANLAEALTTNPPKPYYFRIPLRGKYELQAVGQYLHKKYGQPKLAVVRDATQTGLVISDQWIADLKKELDAERNKHLQQIANNTQRPLSEAEVNARILKKYIGKRAEITEKLKTFAGTKFDIGYGTEDREQADFLWWLLPTINDAGWVHIDWVGGRVFKRLNWPGDHLMGIMSVINVSIEVYPDNRGKLQPAADALVEALKSAGIEATTGDFNNSSTNNDAIHLLVGPKR